MRGCVVIDDFQHGIHEPEDSRGVHPFAVHDGASDQCEMCAVNESHSIEQEEAFCGV
jgi:hypothetical protein